MHLIVLPLEPLPERYTIQWDRWFRQALQRQSIPYTFVDGQTLTSAVETGVVLDAIGTNYWKFTQLTTVCQMFRTGAIKDGDVFFTMDVWHPGLEAIPYMATLTGLQVKVYGFLHAGSYTAGDFAVPMAPWARHFEQGWAAVCDGVFVGTEFHRQDFLQKRFPVGSAEHTLSLPEAAAKVHVTGNPFDTADVLSAVRRILPPNQRLKVIIFPHRWDREKRPDVFMDMMDKLWERRQDFEVIITTSRPTFHSNDPALIDQLARSKFYHRVLAGLTKEQYYGCLNQARVFVSTAEEENFGYCVVEAATLGCSPVVPNRLSHPEVLNQDPRFLYDTSDEALEKIDRFLDCPIQVPFQYVERYDRSIDRILAMMEVA